MVTYSAIGVEEPEQTGSRRSSLYKLALYLALFQALGGTVGTMNLIGTETGSFALRMGLILSAVLLCISISGRIVKLPLTLTAFILASLPGMNIGNLLPQQIVQIGILSIFTFSYVNINSAFSPLDFHRALSRLIIFMCAVSIVLYFLGLEGARAGEMYSRNIVGGDPLVGIFQHKIESGYYAVIGAIALYFSPVRNKYRQAALYIPLFVVLVLSGSGTGLALAVITPFILFLARLKTSLVVISLLVCSLILPGILYLWGDDILSLGVSLVGRSTDLTGRTDFWEVGFELFRERPLFGWGFGILFGPDGLLSQIGMVVGSDTYTAPHFHNSYLQILVEFGLVGFIPFSIILFLNSRHILINLKDRELLPIWIVTLILGATSYNLYPWQFGWLFLCFLVTKQMQIKRAWT